LARYWKLSFWLLACPAIFHGCAGAPTAPITQDTIQDSAPQLRPAELARLASLPDPIVQPLRYSAAGNGPIYEVWGKKYRVLDSAKGYRETGSASWYGVKFHGRLTSSREPFDMYELTAAHRSLPIPCFVRVKNLENGKSAIVRVNDRGPFHSERIIDLSFAAAVKLGFHQQGTAQVLVEAIDANSQLGPSHLIELGAFMEQAHAQRVQQQLLGMLGVPVRIVRSAQALYRLEVGPVFGDVELERLTAVLTTMDLGEITVVLAR